METDLKADFDRAAAYLRCIAGKLDSSDLLFFYARFKQAKEGPCNTPKPGFFDFQGKQKWSAWKELGDANPERAMQEYVSRLGEIDPEWRGQEPEDERGWISVSTMGRDTDPIIEADDKTIFDWVKESNVEKVKHCLETLLPSDVNMKDESGLGLIHWAADRGSVEIVQLLVDAGVDVNLLDDDRQTALHFACSCGHYDVVKTLLDARVDVSVVDSDGTMAKETTDDENILKLFV